VQVSKGHSTSSKLELWGGKRLNEIEKKVDSQLYKIRFNTSAKTELLVGWVL